MDAENKKPTNENKDNSRNSMILVNVSNAEKALLQKMADELELALDEYVRLKGLADIKTIYYYEKELERVYKEIKRLKLSLSLITKCNLTLLQLTANKKVP